MAIKGLKEVLPKHIPGSEYPCPIFLWTKANKIPRGPTIDVSKFPPWFMIQMDFEFFNVESIHRFTSTFVAICSATPHPFGLPSRRKYLPLDILKFIVPTLRNKDDKFAFIRFYEYGALKRSYEFMKTCNNMNIIVQTTGGDAY